MFIIPQNYPISCQPSQSILSLAAQLESLIRQSASPSPEQTIALRQLQQSTYYAIISTNKYHLSELHEEIDNSQSNVFIPGNNAVSIQPGPPKTYNLNQYTQPESQPFAVVVNSHRPKFGPASPVQMIADIPGDILEVDPNLM